MGILAWVALGLVAGLIADYVLKTGLGIVPTIVLGIVGALVGGFVSHQILGLGDVTGSISRASSSRRLGRSPSSGSPGW